MRGWCEHLLCNRHGLAAVMVMDWLLSPASNLRIQCDYVLLPLVSQVPYSMALETLRALLSEVVCARRASIY